MFFIEWSKMRVERLLGRVNGFYGRGGEQGKSKPTPAPLKKNRRVRHPSRPAGKGLPPAQQNATACYRLGHSALGPSTFRVRMLMSLSQSAISSSSWLPSGVLD